MFDVSQAVSIGLFLFFSQKCIPNDWVCDNEVDCGSDPVSGRKDDSDEDPALCKRHSISCGPNQLMCKVCTAREAQSFDIDL